MRHFPLNRIPRFCAETWSIKPGERAELAHHLSTGCRRCWSAVEDIAPGSVEHSCDPLAEALFHLSTPRSRAVLEADHLAAVDDVRRRPFGFAFLLVEEAFSLAWNDETPIPLESDVFKLLGTLRPGRHHEHHADLYATALACLSMVRTSRGETDRAHVAWVMAERDRMAGTGDHRVNAAVLEARALLAAAEDDPRVAETFLTAALERLAGEPRHALRRYELYGRLAEVVVDAGEIERLPAILARANCLLATALTSADPFSRARAIYKRAALTACLAAKLEPGRWQLGSALRWAVDELEQAGALFASATNATTQTLRLLCLSRLYSFFDAERAAELHGEAMSRIQPEAGRSSRAVADPVTAACSG